MLVADKTLAELGLVANNGPCEVHALQGGAGTKFLLAEMGAATAGASPELRSGMYLLLSLVLELWRRNEYAFGVLKSAVGEAGFDAADPELAAQIYLHNKGLHSFEDPEIGSTDWKARAEMASDIVHSLLLDAEAPHAKALKDAVAKTDIFAVFARECAKVPGLMRLVGGGPSSLAGGGGHSHGDGPVSPLGPQIKKAA